MTRHQPGSAAAICAALAAEQYGVVAPYQLRSQLSASAIRHELSNRDRWLRLGRRVFRSTASPNSPRAEVVAGALAAGPGSTVSHATAAWAWRLGSFRPAPIHITRSRWSNSAKARQLFVPHESRRLPPDDVTVLDGFAVTTPARTLVDLATQVPLGRLERTLDQAWSLGLVDWPHLIECCERLGVLGRPGVAAVMRLLDDRGPHWIAPASNLESRVNQLLRARGLGEVRRQVNLGGHTWLGRVDFLHPVGVVIEVQSERFHAALTSQRDDAFRLAALRREGLTVVEVWDSEIWSNPELPMRRIEIAVGQRQRRTA